MPASIEVLLAERIERLAPRRQIGARDRRRRRTGLLSWGDRRDGSGDVGDAVDEHLADLDRREYIRPTEGSLGSEAAFAFRHLLIRDAAYRRLSKGTRARMHASFAAWLKRTGGAAFSGQDEIVGVPPGAGRRVPVLRSRPRPMTTCAWPGRRRSSWRRPGDALGSRRCSSGVQTADALGGAAPRR